MIFILIKIIDILFKIHQIDVCISLVQVYENEEGIIIISKSHQEVSRPKTEPRLAPTLTLLCERTNQSKP